MLAKIKEGWLELTGAAITLAALYISMLLLFGAIKHGDVSANGMALMVCIVSALAALFGTQAAYAMLRMGGYLKMRPDARFWHMRPYRAWDGD